MTLNTELLFGKNPAAGGYQIERSLRFNSSDSAYLSKNFASAGNRKTWTWAGWVKRSVLGAAYKMIFSAGVAATECSLRFTNSPADALELYQYSGGGFNWQLVTTQVFRDPSSWYHIVAAVDSTQATSSDRAKLYVNGVQVTAFGTASYPTSNYDSLVNSTTEHGIGRVSASQYFDGYLADIHFIDGQALDPTSFGEFDANGVWQPKAYTGTYSGNSFHLPFSDNSTAAALGTDTSGNSNNWTVNNISVAAGAGNDSLVDTPTSYGEDTGAGGEVRGNYCTLNLLAKGPSTATVGNGNLDYSAPSDGVGLNGIQSTISNLTSGKWYFEGTVNSGAGTPSSGDFILGWANSSWYPTINPDGNTNCWYLQGTTVGDVAKENGATAVQIFPSWANGDIFMIAIDIDAQLIWFGKNGTWAESGNPSAGASPQFSNLSGSGYGPFVRGPGANLTVSLSLNFGQRPFAYPAPSGFKALCTTNLPEPLVAKPSTVMDVKLYTGNGSTQTISGLGFSPDLAWIKCRSEGSTNPAIWDVVRGPGTSNLDTNRLSTDNTNAEEANDIYGYVSAFNSDGITVEKGSTTTVSNTNRSGQTYVAWTWDAGSSTVTNTQGSITSQVRANPSAGFSIVTYTGNGSFGATVGHGLGAAPSFIITKNRDQGPLYFWTTYHASLGATQYLQLNATDAAVTNIGAWNNTAPTSSVFTLGNFDTLNRSGDRMVAYCFAPVAGYSAFGSYTGNGSADGPFVYTGFRPRFIMIKKTSGADDWVIQDTARDTYNVAASRLFPNLSNADNTASALTTDICSNGFKIRNTASQQNSSSATYIYAAFAEHPFQYARAR